MFKKILLCVDDTPLADQIADMGVDVARRYRADVVVLSVLDPARFPAPPYSGLEAIHMVDRHTKSLANSGERIRAMLESLGIDTRLLVLPGKTADTVVEVACQERADLIVMGGENKSRLRAALEGSLWGDVARTAPCNVLRVSPKEEPVSTPRRGRSIMAGLSAFRALQVDPLAS